MSKCELCKSPVTCCKCQLCKYCDELFVPGIRHTGLITVCLELECQQRMRTDGHREPPPITGGISWENKHTPVLTLFHNPQESAVFNGQQQRFGAGVQRTYREYSKSPGMSVTQVRVAGKDLPEAKTKLEPGAQYRSRLGEAHHLKR